MSKCSVELLGEMGEGRYWKALTFAGTLLCEALLGGVVVVAVAGCCEKRWELKVSF